MSEEYQSSIVIAGELQSYELTKAIGALEYLANKGIIDNIFNSCLYHKKATHGAANNADYLIPLNKLIPEDKEIQKILKKMDLSLPKPFPSNLITIRLDIFDEEKFNAELKTFLEIFGTSEKNLKYEFYDRNLSKEEAYKDTIRVSRERYNNMRQRLKDNLDTIKARNEEELPQDEQQLFFEGQKNIRNKEEMPSYNQLLSLIKREKTINEGKEHPCERLLFLMGEKNT